MRSGACSVQQALTTEAASVLKLSLTLARRRGHAQVTPLHVAATLLTSSSSSSSYSLLRRACLKSHPHHYASHPLQCRALELCFNVALNRLPTTPPPSSSSSSSSSLIQSQPCLSNALIAALKRAQAHQRRGCIEHQQHFHLHNQQQQQQPLLAIKVELDQLIISILDDPSVSRVMREAGFSSTSVKTNLEVDSTSSLVISSSSSSSSSSPSHSLSPSSFFFDCSNRGEIITQASLLHAHYLKPSFEQNPLVRFTVKEDLKVVLEAMLRKQGRRNNTVIVGDSVSIAEGVVSELIGRLERGEVPDELKSSHLIKLQLPYDHLKIMSKGEVELKVTDLKSKVTSISSSLSNGGVIVYVGDLKWALDGETGGAVDYLIEEVGMLISELKKKKNNNKVWLMATSSYQTYMRCQVRHPSLETQWALQAVVVPTGGLKLTLQAPSSGLDSRMLKDTQYPFQMLEPKAFNLKEEEDKFHCCGECISYFEKEASLVKSESNTGSTHLPCWLRPHNAESHQKEILLELKRKWNRLCRNLHHSRHSSVHVLPPYPPSHPPWWSGILNDNKYKTFNEPKPISSPPLPWLCDVKTTLALGNPMFSDTATSTDQRRGDRVNQKELSRQLKDNIPWQPETIPSILEALSDCQSKNGIWLLISGSDHIGKKRLARVLAESFFGSTDRFIYFNARSGVEILTKAMRKESKCVVFIEGIDQANGETTETLSKCIKTGLLKDPFGGEVELCHAIFILATSSTATTSQYLAYDKVLKMRLCVEEKLDSEHKRKSPELEFESGLNDNEEMKKKKKKKKLKASETAELFDLDLNICAEDSDLTQELDGNNQVELPNWLLECSGGVPIITMDENSPSGAYVVEEKMLSKMSSAVADGGLIVDRTAVEGLMGAMGGFLESEFERWVREVFELSVVTVKRGGKVMVVRLGLEGNKEGNVVESGFLGSALPKRIHLG